MPGRNKTKEHPIIFTTDMVRAILEGKKTQTRCPIKPQPSEDFSPDGCGELHKIDKHRDFVLDKNGDPIVTGWGAYDVLGGETHKCPYGGPGDLLWVKEVWAPSIVRDYAKYLYRADPMFDSMELGDFGWRWKSARFMPRAAARIYLEVKSVRAERVQDITEQDAIAEGASLELSTGLQHECYRDAFGALWDSINAKRGFGWDSDCWVWAIEFERVEAKQ